MITFEVVMRLLCSFGCCGGRLVVEGMDRQHCISKAREQGWSIGPGDRCRCPEHKGLRQVEG